MLGSSFDLSLLSRRTSKVELREIPRVKNSYKKSENGRFDPFLTRADPIQPVIAREQPIGIKRKRALSSSPAHGLSIDTIFVRLTALVK